MQLIWTAPENKKEEDLPTTSGTFICHKGFFSAFPQTLSYGF